jgi:hypothetical protein
MKENSMNDLEKTDQLKPYTPTRILSGQGVTAIASLAAGIFLFLMNILGARFPVVGIVLGAASALLGFMALRSRDRDDKKPGAVLAAAGILEILSKVAIPVIRPLAGVLLNIGGVGLIAMGIWNGIKFLKGLKSRS